MALAQEERRCGTPCCLSPCERLELRARFACELLGAVQAGKCG